MPNRRKSRSKNSRFWTVTPDGQTAEDEPRGNCRTVLLHSCCAPCSTSVIETLREAGYSVTVYFYNPNIFPQAEYVLRRDTQRRFLEDVGVPLVCGDYDCGEWEKLTASLPFREGGARCRRCIEMRVAASARYAAEHGFNFVTTTLSVSPHKNADIINEILGRACTCTDVSPLYGNFKKRGGFQRGTELSRQYDIYRQNYCGCTPT